MTVNITVFFLYLYTTNDTDDMTLLAIVDVIHADKRAMGHDSLKISYIHEIFLLSVYRCIVYAI